MAQPIHYRYDTFSPRIASTIIDGLIVITPSITLQYLVDMAGVFWLSFFVSIFTTIAVWAYYILGHGLYGRTVGKKQQNLRVVDFKTELPIDMVQAFRRELLFIVLGSLVLSISALIDFVPITEEARIAIFGYGVMFFQSAFLVAEIVYCLNNSKRRAIHDLVGGTVVVRDNVPLVTVSNDIPASSEG